MNLRTLRQRSLSKTSVSLGICMGYWQETYLRKAGVVAADCETGLRTPYKFADEKSSCAFVRMRLPEHVHM